MSAGKILTKIFKKVIGGLEPAATKGAKKVIKSAEKEGITPTIEAVTVSGKATKLSQAKLDKLLKLDTDVRLAEKSIIESDIEGLKKKLKKVEALFEADEAIDKNVLNVLKNVNEAKTLLDISSTERKNLRKGRKWGYAVGGAGLATLVGASVASSGGTSEPLNEQEFEKQHLQMEPNDSLKSYEELRMYLGDLYGPQYVQAMDEAVSGAVQRHLYSSFDEMPDYI